MNTPDLATANAARLDKAYQKLFRFGQNVLTLKELVTHYPPQEKRVSVQTVTKKRVHLCHEALARPRYRYHVIIDGGWYEVGKLVYDDLTDTPEGAEIAEG